MELKEKLTFVFKFNFVAASLISMGLLGYYIYQVNITGKSVSWNMPKMLIDREVYAETIYDFFDFKYDGKICTPVLKPIETKEVLALRH